MSKDKTLEECWNVRQAINFILDNRNEKTSIDKKKVVLANKTEELIIFPEDVKFSGRIQLYFTEAFNDSSLADFSDDEIHNKARDLAIKISQLDYRRGIADLQRGPDVY